MYSVRKLEQEKDFKSYARVVGYAYPSYGINTEEDINKYTEFFMKTHNENPFVKFYGIYNKTELLGGMRFHDFNMKLLSCKIKAGGVGLVAVNFLNKKEKIAKEIVAGFIDHYRATGASMAMLYPFRPDFYKKMGFGFGTPMNQYRVKPEKLPKGTSKANISFASEEDAGKLLQCYTRMYEKTNGLIEKYESEFAALIKGGKSKVVVYKKAEKIEGFLVFEFKSGSDRNPLVNDMNITAFLYENVEAFGELLTFLNSQSDQIRNIIFNTQDESFRFILEDPRDDSDNMFTFVYHETNLQGTGIMYRVIDIEKLFSDLKGHNFNNETLSVKLTIKDDFIAENNGSLVVDFNNGFAKVNEKGKYDVEVKMGIADFSSLVTCSVDFNSLYRYGRAELSKPEYSCKINNIFSSADKPICMSMF